MPQLIYANLDSKINWIILCKSLISLSYMAVLSLCLIESVKNLESYCKEYSGNIHFYNYPYYTVWDCGKVEDGMDLYRKYQEKIEKANTRL